MIIRSVTNPKRESDPVITLEAVLKLDSWATFMAIAQESAPGLSCRHIRMHGD